MVTASSQFNGGAASSPAAAAEQIFGESPYHTMRGLKCSYRDGVLVVSGQVPNYYLKALAHIAVRDLNGVQRIRNEVQVLPSQ